VVKLLGEQLKQTEQSVSTSLSSLHCPPAPARGLQGSRADSNFIAGMLIDKQNTIDMLGLIAEAQLVSIRRNRAIEMDETSIKARVIALCKMRSTYFWPIYGACDEICFSYYQDRKTSNLVTTASYPKVYSLKRSVVPKNGLTVWRCFLNDPKHPSTRITWRALRANPMRRKTWMFC
jgi:hypothetical protein